MSNDGMDGAEKGQNNGAEPPFFPFRRKKIKKSQKISKKVREKG